MLVNPPAQPGLDGAAVTGRDLPHSVSMARFLQPLDPSRQDATYAVREALAYCRQNGIRKLIFPRGTYEFHRDSAWERPVYASNNDSGIKRIVFLLDGFNDFEIDGGGSHFLFHGFLNPFVIENSQRIALRNFSIDFHRTFHSEGTILAVGDGTVDVAFSSNYPHKISNGLLTFTGHAGDEKTEYPVSALLEFDAVRRETAFMARDYYITPQIHATDLGSDHVRLQVENFRGTPGNTLVFDALRTVPGIVIQHCAAIDLVDLTIHHAGGMGIIAQGSRDLLVGRVKVTPSGARMISTTADATHFVNCSGKISIIDCLFENMMDDATNVHGIYVKISQLLSPCSVEARVIHPQQAGADFFWRGQTIELVDSSSLVTRELLTIAAVECLNSTAMRITFVALPENLRAGDLLAVAEDQAELLFERCIVRNNRARGILLGSRRRIVIQGNTFHTPGSPILLEGDGRHWYEQAGVRDLTICDNIFDNCGYGVWGKGLIEASPGLTPGAPEDGRYNRNIVIEDNVFRAFDGHPIVHGHSIDGLVYRRNRVEKGTAYPFHRGPSEPIQITHSDRISIEPQF